MNHSREPVGFGFNTTALQLLKSELTRRVKNGLREVVRGWKKRRDEK